VVKFGFNLLLWTPHLTPAHAPLLKALKKAGYDGVEVPVFEGDLDHYARLGALLDEIGLERTVVSVIGPGGRNPLSADTSHRKSAIAYTRRVIDCTAALGASTCHGSEGAATEA
jgi:D-psicose/D-tagatose/L-ribulose 3-epimerase